MVNILLTISSRYHRKNVLIFPRTRDSRWRYRRLKIQLQREKRANLKRTCSTWLCVLHLTLSNQCQIKTNCFSCLFDRKIDMDQGNNWQTVSVQLPMQQSQIQSKSINTATNNLGVLQQQQQQGSLPSLQANMSMNSATYTASAGVANTAPLYPQQYSNNVYLNHNVNPNYGNSTYRGPGGDSGGPAMYSGGPPTNAYPQRHANGSVMDMR